MNTGKKFEEEFKASCDRQHIWHMRIKDTYIQAKILDPDAYIPKQVCDFIMHKDGKLWLMELKSTVYKSMSIEREAKDKGMIHYSQWQPMLKLAGENERAGFLLQFYRGQEEQTTYYLDIKHFENFINRSEKKSINMVDVVDYGGVVIPQYLLKKNYVYDIDKIIKL